MFGKWGSQRGSRGAEAEPARASRRHGRRPMRSSITGSGLLDPNGRMLLFKRSAGAVIQYLQSQFPEQLDGVTVGFATMPIDSQTAETDDGHLKYYEIDRQAKSIVLYRMPIQRFRGLHVNDSDHQRMFVEHCAYRAVCEYLEVEPWELMPGRFDHF